MIELVKKILFKANISDKSFDEIFRFIKFSIVGSGNASIDFGLYLLLTRFVHIQYLIANAASWFTAVCFSFFMNKYWTFQSYDHQSAVKQYIKFFIVSIISLFISTYLLYIFVDRIRLHDVLGKILTIGVVTFWNFFMHKYWTFRR